MAEVQRGLTDSNNNNNNSTSDRDDETTAQVEQDIQNIEKALQSLILEDTEGWPAFHQSVDGVYIWGRGGDGQLGHGDTADQLQPRLVTSLQKQGIKHIQCGGKHTVCCDERGDVYTWGWNWSGQLGHGDNKDELLPRHVKSLALVKALGKRKFVQVAAGNEHTCAVTDFGEVYTWGGDHEGQLGTGGEGTTLIPRLVVSLHKYKIEKIACGGGHTMALTSSGTVFSWGRGSHGRLGHGDETDHNTPQIIKSLAKNAFVVTIACGWSTSMCITDTNHLYTWGKGEDGALGHGDHNNQFFPKCVECLKPAKLVDVSGGYYHTAVLTDVGVFTFGWDEYGQLGLGKIPDNSMKTVPTPALVQGLSGKNVIQVACGGFHSTCVTAEGECYIMGNLLGEVREAPVVPQQQQPQQEEEEQQQQQQQQQQEQQHPQQQQEPEQQNHQQQAHEEQQQQQEEKERQQQQQQPEQQQQQQEQQQHQQEQNQAQPQQQQAPSNHTLREPVLVMSPTFNGKFVKFVAAVDDFVGPSATLKNFQLHASRAAEATRNKIKTQFEKTNSLSMLPGRRTRASAILDTSDGAVTSPPASPSLSPATPRPNTSMLHKMGSWLAHLLAQSGRFSQSAQQNEQEWHTVLEQWDKIELRSKKHLWRAGIPLSMRGLVWSRAIGNKLQISRKLFKILEEHAKEQKLNTTTRTAGMSDSYRLIEVDLPRTWSGLQLFDNSGPFYNQISVVLEAYATLRPDVGYVQGMSYIAAMLLLYMDTYDAFVSLANLLNSHFFLSLFKMNLKEMLRHICVFEYILSFSLPDVYAHFKKLGISAEQYLLDWLMTVFSKSLPTSLACRIWDCFFLEGEVFVYRAAVGLIKLCQSQLCKMDFEDAVTLLRHLSQEIKDEQKVIDSILSVKIPPFVNGLISKIAEEGKKNLDIGVRTIW